MVCACGKSDDECCKGNEGACICGKHEGGGCACGEKHEGDACGCGEKHAGEGCGCGDGCDCGTFERKVYSKEEKIEWMKTYQSELEAELKAVKEKISELEKA